MISDWWRSRRVLLIAAVTVLIVAAVLRWRTPPLPVDVGVVDQGPLRVTLDESGTTRVRDHADINAPVSGRWAPQPLQIGDSLRPGTPLGTLYPLPMDRSAYEQAMARLGAATALVEEASSRVQAARNALDEARRALRRTERLVDAGGLAPVDLELARNAVTAHTGTLQGIVAQVDAATFEKKAVQALLASERGSGGMLLRTPVGGVLLRHDEAHERVVAAGTRLAEVGNPQEVEVLIPLLTTDAIRVRHGASVLLDFGGGTVSDSASQVVPGTVRRVEPTAFAKISALGVEEQRVNVVATITPSRISRHVQIGDQYRVQARITISEAPHVARIPMGALMREGSRWSAWIVERQRATRRYVEIGERNDQVAEVRLGLAVGDTVILYADDRIREGTRVMPAGQRPAKGAPGA